MQCNAKYCKAIHQYICLQYVIVQCTIVIVWECGIMQHIVMWCNVLNYIAMQCKIYLCCNTLSCNIWRCNTIHCNAIYGDAMQYIVVQYMAMRFNAMPGCRLRRWLSGKKSGNKWSLMQSQTIQCNRMQAYNINIMQYNIFYSDAIENHLTLLHVQLENVSTRSVLFLKTNYFCLLLELEFMNSKAHNNQYLKKELTLKSGELLLMYRRKHVCCVL